MKGILLDSSCHLQNQSVLPQKSGRIRTSGTHNTSSAHNNRHPLKNCRAQMGCPKHPQANTPTHTHTLAGAKGS